MNVLTAPPLPATGERVPYATTYTVPGTDLEVEVTAANIAFARELLEQQPDPGALLRGMRDATDAACRRYAADLMSADDLRAVARMSFAMSAAYLQMTEPAGAA